jgi:Flp pilus assembly protein TadB
MVDLIIRFLLIALLVLQIVILVHMLICQIKRNKEDKKFWEQMDNAIKEQVNRYNNLYPDEPLKLEEDSTSEQDK